MLAVMVGALLAGGPRWPGRAAADGSRARDGHAPQRAQLHRPPAQESRRPREHLAPRLLGLAQRDRRHARPRALPRAHGVQRIGQFPAGLRGAVLSVSGPRVRARPERLHELRSDDVPAHGAGRPARTRSTRRWCSCPTSPCGSASRTPEIDGERQIILEEKRSRSSARQRVQDQVYERLAPESTLGRRLPIGSEETIKAVGRDDFVDYYSRWYVPSNMTVIVVGDADPALVVDLIKRDFGGGPTVPRPAPRDVGVKATAGPRAVVVTDSELTRVRGLDRADRAAARARDDGRAEAARDGRSHRRLDVQPPDERRDRGGQGRLRRRRRLRLRLAGDDAHDRASRRPGGPARGARC